MNRFTISLDPELAQAFDAWLANQGGPSRSEAVRDLIRDRLGHETLAAGAAKWCIATVSYVHARQETVAVAELLRLQHDHHELVLSVQRVPLDHDDCLETVVLRGATAAVRACAARMIAIRGVRHGQVQVVPLQQQDTAHCHADPASAAHRHFEPFH